MNSELLNNLVIRRLEEDDIVSSFDCGDDDLNDFILNSAHRYCHALLAVTYVMTHIDKPDEIVAFCSLANDRVSIENFQSKTEFNRFRRKQGFPQEKRLKSYPAVKLCRLGVDKSVRGMSLGTVLMDFVKSYFIVKNKTGCRFLTVDAYREAIPFYEKNQFCPLSSDDEESTYTRTLFFDLKDGSPR